MKMFNDVHEDIVQELSVGRCAKIQRETRDKSALLVAGIIRKRIGYGFPMPKRAPVSPERKTASTILTVCRLGKLIGRGG
jgi:hypothetical protein